MELQLPPHLPGEHHQARPRRGGELGEELGDGEEEPAQRGVGGVVGGATARQRLNGGEQAGADEEGRVGGDEGQAQQLEELGVHAARGGLYLLYYSCRRGRHILFSE